MSDAVSDPMNRIDSADNTSHTSYLSHPMSYGERHSLFRTHAGAVFGGDTAEAARLRRLIYPDHALAHQVFAFALFATCIEERFGDDLDWAAMDVLIEHVRRTAPGVSPLKTEALIRACYDEPQLFMEVPQSEQVASFWAVCRLIVGTERDERELADLFERADDFGRDVVRDIFASSQLHTWGDEAARSAPEHSAPAPSASERSSPEYSIPQSSTPEHSSPERVE